MAEVVPITFEISRDEECFSYLERNKLSADYKSLRRVRQIMAIRGDWLALYEQDMGPAASFTADEISITAGEVKDGKIYCYEIVGDCLDMADQLRAQGGHNKTDIQQLDVLGSYRNELERSGKI